MNYYINMCIPLVNAINKIDDKNKDIYIEQKKLSDCIEKAINNEIEEKEALKILGEFLKFFDDIIIKYNIKNKKDSLYNNTVNYLFSSLENNSKNRETKECFLSDNEKIGKWYDLGFFIDELSYNL